MNNINFVCEYCNYTTNHRGRYNRHNNTESHHATKLGKYVIKSEFVCEFCHYTTIYKNNYDRHVKSKHPLNSSSFQSYTCNNCGIKYKTASGLWKHIKNVCNKKSDTGITNEMFIEMMSQNKELQNVLVQQNEDYKNKILELSTIQPMITNNTTNNTTNNNQKLNLNIFLNETCKDAINFSEFMNSIHVSNEDLEKTASLGYVDGISRIIVNALKNTDMEHRPLHCTDIKRETVYIKEGNKWDKENKEQENLKRAVQYISNKNLGKIQEWKKENPESLDSNHRKSEVLNIMYSTSLSREPDKEDPKIIRNVLKEIVLDDDT